MLVFPLSYVACSFASEDFDMHALPMFVGMHAFLSWLAVLSVRSFRIRFKRFISSDLRFKTRVEWIEVSLKREIKILNTVRTQTDPIQNLLINCQTPCDKKRVRG